MIFRNSNSLTPTSELVKVLPPDPIKSPIMTAMTPSNLSHPLLTVDALSVAFPTDQGDAFAVRNVSLSLAQGEVLGLVGESGCGKSMTSLALLGLIPKPGRVVSGDITFNDYSLRALSDSQWQRIRGAQIALIPQDPLTSLNPVYTIGDQLSEVLIHHKGLSKAEALKQSAAMLDLVRMPSAESRLKDYPHQFSGGMRQRVMIAMALLCQPQLLIADEPTTALDVTVQAQILTLMRDIQQEFNTAILMITHDLGVIAEMCDRVAVMYAGAIVEDASVNDLFDNPLHPYTQGLLNALPRPGRERLESIEGQPPSLSEKLTGCRFEPRCPKRLTTCTEQDPTLNAITDQHQAACLLY